MISRALHILYICLLVTAMTDLAAQQQELIVEPPYWWVGMEMDTIQIMIHGPQVGQRSWSISSDKVDLLEQHKADSDNYVFLDVALVASAPGSFDICPTASDGQLDCISYELRARRAGAAEIQGFDQSDALYLITPDRFANGDPRNDEFADMADSLHRAEPYGRHGGDIAGITEHLDYIGEMGFTAIWLNPVLENDMPHASYHGYATTDYYRVDPRYGSNDEYRDMVSQARNMGIKVIMDQIANHCGSEHWWMRDPPFEDWLNHQTGPYQQTSHRKATLLDPYRSQIDRTTMTDGWFVPTMPDLNQRNPYMARYLIQNSIWWIEDSGISGIRQDTYSYPDRDFMGRWTCAIYKEYPGFTIVGEEWTDDPSTIAFWMRDNKIARDKFDFHSCLSHQMDFPVCMSMHAALTEDEGWNTGLIQIYETLAQDHLYPHPADLVIFPDNHDMTRIFTKVNEDYTSYQMALVLTATLRGVPQVYYGTEILMSHPGTESHGVIRSDFPGGWRGDSRDAFSGKGLSETESTAQEWVRQLFTWRKSHPTIHHGQLMHYVPKDGVYVYFRYDDDHTVMVVINKNEEPYSLDLNRFSERLASQGTPEIVIQSASCTVGADHMILDGPGAYILEY